MSGAESYTWVPLDLTHETQVDSCLPEHAVLGGWEREKPTFVARAWHEDHWEVGKLNAWARIGYSFFGRELESAVGELLVARGGQSPVWVNGAFGEAVEDVMTSRADNHIQLVGRVWHKDRWIPGKVVPYCHRIFFPYGGQELSARKYQLLSTDFTWEPAEALNSCSTRSSIPVDSCMPVDATNRVAMACQHAGPGSGEMKILARASLRECSWVVSGDGEYVRHAVTNEAGFLLARVWVDDSRGFGQWVPGCVNAGSMQAGIFVGGSRYLDYQVLTASPVPQSRKEALPEVSRLLSLSISLDTLEGMLENDLTPPENIFMITKLEPGERPWSAVREMMTNNGMSPSEAKVSDHLRPMMPIIEELAAKEGMQEPAAAVADSTAA